MNVRFIKLFILLNLLFGRSFSAKKSCLAFLESVNLCQDNDKLRDPVRNLSLNKINQTHNALSFDLEFHEDLDEKTSVRFIMERWTSNRWMKVPILDTLKDPCKTMLSMFPLVWIPFAQHLHVEKPDQCPVPKGKYHLDNWSIHYLQRSCLPGKFRVTVSFFEDKNPMNIFTCLQFIQVTKEVE